MKCNQSTARFELVSPCPFPTTMTITPREPPRIFIYMNVSIQFEKFIWSHPAFIPLFRVPWEKLAVKEKRTQVKTAPKSYRKNPTKTNAIQLKKAQYQLTGIYLKEQTEYIQNQIDKIRDSVEDRQSRIAWQTINEVSRRESTTKAKLKAANQQERIKL